MGSEMCIRDSSKHTQKLIKKFLGRDSELLYPPVPVHLYDGGKNLERENLVVTIASLNPTKNLEVIPEVCERVPEAKFILLGFYHPKYAYILRSLEKKLAEKGLKDRFTYLGSATNLEKKLILSRAKVIFHPTINEPFGISIVEGMAAGLIPVVHDSGGPQEFTPKEWRYSELEEAAQKIREALQAWNPQKAWEMKEKAQYFREERFEAEALKIVEKHLERRISLLN